MSLDPKLAAVKLRSLSLRAYDPSDYVEQDIYQEGCDALDLGALALEYVEALEADEDLQRTCMARSAYLAAAHPEKKP